MLLSQAFNMTDGNKIFQDITARKEFFQALANALKAQGTEVAWVQAAADVSEKLEWLTVCKKFCGDSYAWMEKVGTLILSNRWTDLKSLFQSIAPLTGDAALNWDTKILTTEQAEVQGEYNDLTFEQFKAVFVGAFSPGAGDITNPNERIKKEWN